VPIEADTPSAVMHKHLKNPLTPPDHINTALSVGIGEIIEVAMAKNRDDRYASTEDMLEDLRAVRGGSPPTHARRVVNLDELKKLEETGKTVDIVAPPPAPVWSPLMISIAVVAGISVMVNLILMMVMASK
jgi:serine/threonine-protein kinase